MKSITPRLLLLVAVLVGSIGGVGSATSAEQTVAKVRVYRTGKMTLDGKQVTIEQMRKGLSDLKKQKGVVWYFREAPDQEPHPNGPLAVQAIIDNKLPVSMSTKEDFSTVVLPDGTIKQR